MKKILLSSLAALALTACVSDNDLNPVDKYGYINVNVSNDPTMVTRGTISDFSDWTIKVGETTWTSTNNVFTAGTYTVTAKSHESESAALLDNEDWGEAYFTNDGQTDKTIEVIAGQTVTKTIECGKAKNARLKVTFPSDIQENAPIRDYKITFNRNNKDLEFNMQNFTYQFAYFNPGTVVSFTLKYTYNNVEKTAEGEHKITIGEAGTENNITVSANDNGKLNITITHTDFTEENASKETIVIDAANGQPTTD